MFMNVEVEKKILQFQGTGSGRVFSLKKNNSSPDPHASESGAGN
jgi:hypothetical protein